MAGDLRLANEAWEAYSRAHATVARRFTDADIWGDLLPSEYAVLHALSRRPAGLRITELCDDVLITQPGMSRLISRLETNGLVERHSDAGDARARRIRLTDGGRERQRRVGTAFARSIGAALTRTLNREQLEALRDLSLALLADGERPARGEHPTQQQQDENQIEGTIL